MHLVKLPSVEKDLSAIHKRSAAVAPRLPRTAYCTAVSGKDKTPAPIIATRRATLLQLGLSIALVTPAQAQDFILPLDSTERLPRGYQDLTRRLVAALQDSISADINGASENEVRRKADPAKGLVKDWVSKWRDDRAVRGSVSHDQVSATLQQLGQYYQKNGARARMPKDTGNSLLSKLTAAEASLPAEEKKKGLFG